MSEVFKQMKLSKEQQEAIDKINNAATALYDIISLVCTSSRETSLAKTNLEQAVMWANKSISHNNVQNAGKVTAMPNYIKLTDSEPLPKINIDGKPFIPDFKVGEWSTSTTPCNNEGISYESL